MRYLLIGNTCVMCGAEIPEGRQVCPDCEQKVYSRGKQEPVPPERTEKRKSFFDEIKRWIKRK